MILKQNCKDMNTMKKLLIGLVMLIALSIITITASAQETPKEEPKQEDIQQLERDPKAREKIEAARIGVITNKLGLTPEQAEKFWPIYREFTEKRQEMRKEFKAEQNKAGTAGLSPEQQQRLVDLGLQLKQRELDLEKSYSSRLLKVISADQMLRLPPAEREFQRMLVQQLQQRRAMQERRDNLRDRNQLQRQKRN
jgi:hypothetical protein